MRTLIALALALSAGTCWAEAAAPAATSAVAVNTVCPLEGAKVDAKVAPVTGKTKEGKEVAIGACCAVCSKTIAEKPDQFADAAVANKKAEAKTESK